MFVSPILTCENRTILS